VINEYSRNNQYNDIKQVQNRNTHIRISDAASSVI